MKRTKRSRRALLPIVFLGLVGALIGALRAHAEPPAGVLAVDLNTDIDYVDPALSYYTVSWAIEYATCAKLVNHPDLPAPRGSRLVPEIARAMPSVSPDGRTYTFQLRDDFFFSTPASEQVTAQHFKFTLERLFRPMMASPAQPFLDDIVGARDMIDGKTTSLAGVTAVGDTLQITLEAPAGDFLARLSMPFTCPLPLSTPINPDGIQAPVPSAGPYYIETWVPRQRIVVKRNPNYGGSRPHRFDEIQYTIGLPLADIRLRVETGESDFAGDGVPPAAHAELAPLYGPGSSAAILGKQRWFAYPSPAFRYLALNHDRPLFGGAGGAGNVDLKKAVNYVIDRQAMIEVRGPYAGTATDQILPPGLQGYRDAVLYPTRPDEERAGELDGWEPGDPMRPAVMYTCNTGPCIPTAELVKTQLAKIGIDVSIQAFPRAVQFTKTGTRGEPFDISLEGWHIDYLDPYDFMFLLDGSTLRPSNNVNFSYFNHQPYIDQLQAADALSGEARFDALGQLDVDAMRDWAPVAPFINDNTRLFFSDRIGCHYYHPVYEVDLAALCLRPEIPVTDEQVGEDVHAATFSVTLSNAEATSLTVDFTTVDGSAKAGEDYTATSGTLTFPPGNRSKTLTVPILEDGIDEADESFSLRLSNPSKGTPTGGGIATILDNDSPPSPPVTPPPVPPVPPAPPVPPVPPSPPTPPSRTLARAALASGTVAVSPRGSAPISIRCGGAPCRGSVALFAPAGTRGLTARRPVKLGQARFSIARGRTRAVPVKLSARAFKALRRAKRLNAQAVVTLVQSNGRTSVRRSAIVLKAPPRR